MGDEIAVFIELPVPAADDAECLAGVLPDRKCDMNAVDEAVTPLLKAFTARLGNLQAVDYEHVIIGHG